VKQFPRVKPGEALTARHLNVIYAELERLSKFTVTGADRFTNGQDGPTIVLGSGTGRILFGANTSVAFSVNTSRSINLFSRTSTDVKVSAATVYNPSFGAEVPASKKIIAGMVEGDWCVLGYVC
jgi:hypothetical protein